MICLIQDGPKSFLILLSKHLLTFSDVSITEISRKGDGIARVEGFVIFVKDGKAGQNAKVRITQVGQRFASAELVEGTTQ